MSSTKPDQPKRPKPSRGKSQPGDTTPNTTSTLTPDPADTGAEQDDTEFIIERIVNSRISADDGYDYLVHWRGYSEIEATWEPWEEVEETAVYMAFRKEHLRDPNHHFPPPSAQRSKASPKVDGDGGAGPKPRRSTGPRYSLRYVPEPSIDITAYPTLLSLIISYSSPSTLAALLRCSKHLFHAAVPTIYRDLRLTPQQLNLLVEEGTIRSQPSLFIGKSSQIYSASLRESLRHVRQLELLDYAPESTMPILPRGSLLDLEVVILRPTLAWFDDRELIPLPYPRLGGIKGSRLVVHLLPPSQVHPYYTLAELPICMTDITLLLPREDYQNGIDSCLFGSSTKSPRERVTIVDLPCRGATGGPAPHFNKSPRLLLRNVAMERSLHTKEVRYVGLEYLGYTPDQLIQLSGRHDVAYPSTITSLLLTVKEWLDEPENSRIFSAEEEAEIRAADREVAAWASQSQECMSPQLAAAKIHADRDRRPQQHSKDGLIADSVAGLPVVRGCVGNLDV